MVHRNAVPLLAAILMIMAFDRPADACSCAGPGAACQATWDAAAVFVGQVVEVGQNIEAHRAQTTAAPELFFYKRRVRLQVIELFWGPAASTVDVYTGLGGGDCGYDFVAGGTYLIYASESSGRYQTHSCMRTRPLEQATEDLAYLRGFARTPSALGLIDGTAMRWDQDQFSGNMTPLPYAGARVVAEGDNGRHETQTGADGTFEFRVPAGQYQLMIDLPVGFFAARSTVNVRDVRGCAQNHIHVRPDGRISGHLLNANGEPLGHTVISAVRPAPSYQLPGRTARPLLLSTVQMATTKADGSFELQQLPPGTYALGIRTVTGNQMLPAADKWVLHPGTFDFTSATSFMLGSGERRAVGEFIIPAALEVVYIIGVVRDRQGRPVGRAQVILTDGARPNDPTPSRVTTAVDGRFRLPAHSGRQYGIFVSLDVAATQSGRSVAVPPFEAAPNLAPLEITLPD